MTTYIRDIFDLPDRVQRGDFVLRLTEGVTKAEETVKDYVVTPQLAEAFDQAVTLIKTAIQQKSSKAAYLHGSFGSGKSHFMAVLDLLLQGEPHARSIPELAQTVGKHNEWTEGKKFLLVPYHMIGAETMESAILSGYAEHIKRFHPEAPTPGVYRAEELFKDAQNLRDSMGDEAFFAKLNEGVVRGSSGGWGDIGSGWGAASFDAAVNADPKSEDRLRLVGDLTDKFFTAVRGAGEFVDLDTGFSIISKHAKSLGYDAVVLFLDELILWLASHAADIAFVNREGQKLAKLVEAQTADRPVPIISFVARQRDLKELVGDNITGAELVSFSDILGWWEARFSKITLEDRNLPAIAEKRVLRPKSATAKQMLDDAFASTTAIREEVMNVLLTSHANREMFRKLYPFSPALVETLVAVSFWLQRERTALKVMLQLLVEQKDRLQLGEIIPIGDLFDVISEGDEAYSNEIKGYFDNAKKLYYQKLRPILERNHGICFEDLAQLPFDAPQVVALRGDDRLVKTLLLSALASNVESLRGLTASRLAALNHGTIKSPIPNRETQIVTKKCREWAAECGEIKIGDQLGGDPTISVQLTGVDTQSIIAQAQQEDNQGNRIRKIKELLFEQIGVKQEDQLFQRHEFTWRATKRSCEILFTNIRETTLPDSSFVAQGDDWKVIIDFPFDTEGHGPRDDIARLEKFQAVDDRRTRTIVWVPSFLSLQALKELGTLVILDFILTGERFSSYVTHLPPGERSTARSLLDNQRSQLRQRMINYLEGLYGIATPIPGSINTTHQLTPAENFRSLDSGFMVQPPVAANLRDAFTNLLEQALGYQYPAHPLFERDTKLNLPTLRRVYETIEQATQVADGRISVEQSQRKELRQIANPLKLGEMHETHFLLGQHWKIHFLRKEAEHGGPMTVGKMRSWIDQPVPMGLPREVQNLVIMSFAAQTSRSFFLHGGPATAGIENLSDDMELREQTLPPVKDWQAACQRGAAIFGVSSSELLNAANVAKFVSDVKKTALEYKETCERLVAELRGRLNALKLDGQPMARLRTAQAVVNLVNDIVRAKEDETISVLAHTQIASSEVAMGASLRKAETVANALTGVNWIVLESVAKLSDERAAAGQSIWRSVQENFKQDEYAVAFAPALRELEGRAAKILADIPTSKQTPAVPTTFVTLPTSSPTATVKAHIISNGARDGIKAADLDDLVAELRRELSSKPKAQLRLSWEVYEE